MSVVDVFDRSTHTVIHSTLINNTSIMEWLLWKLIIQFTQISKIMKIFKIQFKRWLPGLFSTTQNISKKGCFFTRRYSNENLIIGRNQIFIK